MCRSGEAWVGTGGRVYVKWQHSCDMFYINIHTSIMLGSQRRRWHIEFAVLRWSRVIANHWRIIVRYLFVIVVGTVSRIRQGNAVIEHSNFPYSMMRIRRSFICEPCFRRGYIPCACSLSRHRRELCSGNKLCANGGRFESGFGERGWCETNTT